VRQLELPRSQSRDVLLIDQVDPTCGDRLVLSRLSVDHVLDQVLDLELLLGIQLHGVLLLFLVLGVLLVFLILLVILLFLIFLVLLVFVVLLVLLVLLVFLVLLLLLRRHKLAQNFLHILDAILFQLLVAELRQLRLRFLQLRPHHPVPQPVREAEVGEAATVVELALLEGQVHGAPVLCLLHGAHGLFVFLLLLLPRGVPRILFLALSSVASLASIGRALDECHHLRVVLLLLLFRLLHPEGLGPLHEEDLEVAMGLALFCRHRCLHPRPLRLRQGVGGTRLVLQDDGVHVGDDSAILATDIIYSIDLPLLVLLAESPQVFFSPPEPRPGAHSHGPPPQSGSAHRIFGPFTMSEVLLGSAGKRRGERRGSLNDSQEATPGRGNV